MEIVIFKLNNQKFGINLKDVIFIEKVSKIERVPRSKFYFEGLSIVRDKVTPIYNLKQLLNYSNDNESNMIVVLNTFENDIAILIDEAVEISTINDNEIESHVFLEFNKTGIQGLIQRGEELISIIDVNSLFEFNDVKIQEDMVQTA